MSVNLPQNDCKNGSNSDAKETNKIKESEISELSFRDNSILHSENDFFDDKKGGFSTEKNEIFGEENDNLFEKIHWKKSRVFDVFDLVKLNSLIFDVKKDISELEKFYFEIRDNIDTQMSYFEGVLAQIEVQVLKTKSKINSHIK